MLNKIKSHSYLCYIPLYEKHSPGFFIGDNAGVDSMTAQNIRLMKYNERQSSVGPNHKLCKHTR